MMSKIFCFREHEPKSKETCPELVELENNQSLKFEGYPEDYQTVPKYLGIDSSDDVFIPGYYVGASWLKESEIAAVVLPKIQAIDYLKMFSIALNVSSEKESTYFSKYYGIDFDKPEIEVESSFNIITPLILIHYISILKQLTKKGLKKGYVYQEQNLQSKVKGHLLLHKHLSKNVFTKREDRAFCGFQEYTEDIPENRLLKKALVFATVAISNSETLKKHEIYESLQTSINKLNSMFYGVSDQIEINEVKAMRFNKLFSEYREAIPLAKTILRKYDYSLQNVNTVSNKTLPFWIDMPRLYELYVYGELRRCFGDLVEFQVEGSYGTVADYILKGQNIVLDAKYKPQYEFSNGGILDDIREMSGYARDQKILKHFGSPEDEIPCVIIYPSKIDNETDTFIESNLVPGMNIVENATPIRAFRNFYKIKIEVPMMKNS